MPIRMHPGSRLRTAGRALRRPGAWLLGMCVALGACAEPATPASRANAAAMDAPAQARPSTQASSQRQAAPQSRPSSASTARRTEASHAGHATAQAPTSGARDAKQPRSGKAAAVDASLPRMQVHKSPTCGCCSLWVDHMREAGFAVEVHDTHDLAAVKSRLGVPANAQSCHTAEVRGLVVEGHVPASDIKRALAQGGTRALVLPGMPVNSPGMEVPGINAPPYTVERITTDGKREPFATHGDSARGR